MSDPFDDDDDLFANPETLGLLKEVEDQAIQNSQKPPPSKPRFSQPIRHVLAKPKNSPGSSSSSGNSRLKKEPRPINTEPGIRGGTGFGWEDGGKRSFDVERHIGNVKKREAYWGTGNQQAEEEDESIPIDVVMDGSGRYELVNNRSNTGSGDEAIITDKRRAQPSMLGESLGLNGSATGIGKPTRKQSEDAIQARRRAMAAATSSNTSSEPFSNRQPMSKSNSTSTTNIVTSRLSNNNHVQLQNTNDHKFNANRSLSRSVSAGAQIFQRSNGHSNAVAGPSRLPTIPSEPSSQSRNGSSENGNSREVSAPPMSQGSAARAAAIELDIERRKRQELEAELAALRAQAQTQAQPSRSQVPRQEVEKQVIDSDDKDKVKELQNQLWAAKGEAEMIRRAQKEEHQRHLAELEKLKLTIQDKDVQIKERDNQNKKQMENIKHQAVFSNHAAHNSAMKARPQQSQRFLGGSQSQYRGLPTPVKHGSPSRRRSQQNEEEYTPLIKSVKGKGKAPVSGPTFGGFNNAFAATPTVGPRAKRQKTADLSPQGSPTRGPSPSPFQTSPARSQRKSSPVIGQEDGDDGIDWGPAIEPLGDLIMDGVAEEEERKDEKAELLYHLLNHVTLSTFQTTLGLTTEPTIYRLMNYRPPINVEGHEIYTQRCSEILKACGDPEMMFEDMVQVVANCLNDMLGYGMKVISVVEHVALEDIAVYCNILILLSSTTLLFPLVIRTISDATTITETLKSTLHTIYADQTKLEAYKQRINVTAVEEGERDKKVERENWYLELGDKIAGLAEAICFVSDTPIWKGDELVDIILSLMAPHHDPYIVKRGMELFYVASRQSCNFRSLVIASDKYQVPGLPNESPLIERVSRYLINPHSSASESDSLQMSLLTIRGLCMLSISHPDAVIIMGQKSILVPALIIVLQRESNKLYGIYGVLQAYKDALSLLLPTLSLLHHLVFPSPISISTSAESQQQKEESDPPPVGIDLNDRLNMAAPSREFNGLQHMFVSAMGVMAYSQIDEEVVEEVDQRGIQYLSGDLLENIVEGPEGDAIYELYVPLDEDQDQDQVADHEHQDAGVDIDEDVDVPMEVDDDDGDGDGHLQVKDREKGKGKEKVVRDISEIIEIDDDSD
ncbi:hypothetical protein I302_104521 [Kwoniella bestiolae CBS 10118]|uniref:Uncharacterized protein n=1 Tax=Kwoniella bestiolae CBS 10118 TaxID=1296100 RepID=A0AAJ8K824_9TREE